MSGLAVDANQPKPPLTPLTFVSIPSLISGVLHDTPPGETCTFLSCRPDVDRLVTTIFVIESLYGLAVNFIAAFYEIVNVEQQLAFRCFFGREQCKQAFVIRIFFVACSQQIHSQACPQPAWSLTQVHRSLLQHATAVLVPPLDESLLVAVSWQVCFFWMSCEPVRMHWSDLLCGLSPSLMLATEVSP